MEDGFSVFCDESCHLEHDGQKVMVIGAILCPTSKRKEIYKRIREIKKENGITGNSELKWTKVSPRSFNAYARVVDYFFDDDDLRFRAVVIPDKTALDHKKFQQTHNDFYYKTYFNLLKTIISNSARYDIYIDIKDTVGNEKVKKLQKILCNSVYDFDRRMIRRVQQVRSDEIETIQLADILIGAVMAANRGGVESSAKNELISRVCERSGYKLTKSTLLLESKFNIFVWHENEQ